jgi:hypothetical protein
VNQVLDELLLDEVIEFSGITGKPVHELLGITKEQFKEWLDKRESERKPMRVVFPSFEVGEEQ